VFSNALTFEKYLKIKQYFKDRIKVSAGIGTNLTNDVGTPPPNIVMKLAFCSINDSQIPVSCIKMSDDKDKYIGEEDDFIVAKYQLKIQ
jgi:nicotinate phosphoribosyltransferase